MPHATHPGRRHAPHAYAALFALGCTGVTMASQPVMTFHGGMQVPVELIPRRPAMGRVSAPAPGGMVRKGLRKMLQAGDECDANMVLIGSQCVCASSFYQGYVSLDSASTGSSSASDAMAAFNTYIQATNAGMFLNRYDTRTVATRGIHLVTNLKCP